MSNYTLYSWGASEISDLRHFNPASDFCIEVQFDLKYAEEIGLTSYWFVLANNNGLLNYIKNNFLQDEIFLSIKKVVITNEFKYENVISYLNDNVINKCMELNDLDLYRYLNYEFNKSID